QFSCSARNVPKLRVEPLVRTRHICWSAPALPVVKLSEQARKLIKAIDLKGVQVNLQSLRELTIRLSEDRRRVLTVHPVFLVTEFSGRPGAGDSLTGRKLLTEHFRPSGVECALCRRRQHGLEPLGQFGRESLSFTVYEPKHLLYSRELLHVHRLCRVPSPAG